MSKRPEYVRQLKRYAEQAIREHGSSLSEKDKKALEAVAKLDPEADLSPSTIQAARTLLESLGYRV